MNTLAGSVKGNACGKGNKAKFSVPMGIVSFDDYLYVCDFDNGAIQKVGKTGNRIMK